MIGGVITEEHKIVWFILCNYPTISHNSIQELYMTKHESIVSSVAMMPYNHVLLKPTIKLIWKGSSSKMMYPFLPLLAQPYKLLCLPLRLSSSKYIISVWFSVHTCWIYADSTTFLKWSFFWLTLLVITSLFLTQIQLFSHYSPDCGHR